MLQAVPRTWRPVADFDFRWNPAGMAVGRQGDSISALEWKRHDLRGELHVPEDDDPLDLEFLNFGERRTIPPHHQPVVLLAQRGALFVM